MRGVSVQSTRSVPAGWPLSSHYALKTMSWWYGQSVSFNHQGLYWEFSKANAGQSTKPQGHLARHTTCLICLHWVKAEDHGRQRPHAAQRYTAGLNGFIKPASVFHFSLNGWCGQKCSDFTQRGCFTLAKNVGVNIFLAKGKILCAPKMLAHSQRI